MNVSGERSMVYGAALNDFVLRNIRAFIVNASIPGYPPAMNVGAIGASRNSIAVLSHHAGTGRAGVSAPVLVQFGHGGLDIAVFIRAAGLEHRLFPVPIPGETKPGKRMAQHRLLKLGVLPGLAAVGGDLDPADGAPAGPGQAADLIESAAGQLLSAGGEGDDRFRIDGEM